MQFSIFIKTILQRQCQFCQFPSPMRICPNKHPRSEQNIHGLFVSFQMFELLGTLQMNQLNPEINQWNHQYSVLLANQPGVPQATPAPGFEQRLLMAAPSQLLEQQICASTMPGTKDRSYYVGSYSENFTRHTRKFSLRKHQNWKQSWHAFFYSFHCMLFLNLPCLYFRLWLRRRRTWYFQRRTKWCLL